jgi:hypothetical protein
MAHDKKSHRAAKAISVLLTTFVCCWLVANGSETGQAQVPKQVGQVQSERQGPAGTYLWHHHHLGPDQVTKEAIFRRWLLDTRNGAVYSHGLNKQEGGIDWKLRVNPRIGQVERWGTAGTFQWHIYHEVVRLKTQVAVTTVKLLDTRSGAVYGCRLGDDDFKKNWELDIIPRFVDQ